MLKLSTREFRENISDSVNRAAYGKERVCLQRRGKAIAVIVPVEDAELLEELEDRMDLAAARKALKESGAKPWAKLKAELGL
ncbi:MAG: type II toxin-antitoxin system prevent-host-death family antitoxin [Planctomycetota bacterium]